MYLAYITTYRGTGRPDRCYVREYNPANIDRWTTPLALVDPMANHNGAFVVGEFETEAAAEAAAAEYWRYYVASDAMGYLQWADDASPEEAAELKNVSAETVRRILRDAARRERTFPGATRHGNGNRAVWSIPRSEVEKWQPRKAGRPRADED